MQWVAGTKHSPENDNRLANSSGPAYVMYLNGATYYAESNMPGGTDYTGTDRHVVLQNVIDACSAGGVIVVKGFTVSLYSVTLNANVTVYEYYKGRTRKFMRAGGNSYALVLEHEILGDSRPGIPVWTTRGSCTCVYLKDSCMVLATRKDLAAGTAGQVYFAQEFLYGTYQWKVKLLNAAPAENNGGDWNIFVGFMEEFPSQYRDSIFIEYTSADDKWYFKTRNAGNLESTEITGVTWTNENTLKVEWPDSSSVKLYVNDVLKVTHTTQVPDKAGVAFLEIISGPATTNNIYVYTRDWEKIS